MKGKPLLRRTKKLLHSRSPRTRTVGDAAAHAAEVSREMTTWRGALLLDPTVHRRRARNQPCSARLLESEARKRAKEWPRLRSCSTGSGPGRTVPGSPGGPRAPRWTSGSMNLCSSLSSLAGLQGTHCPHLRCSPQLETPGSSAPSSRIRTGHNSPAPSALSSERAGGAEGRGGKLGRRP